MKRSPSPRPLRFVRVPGGAFAVLMLLVGAVPAHAQSLDSRGVYTLADAIEPALRGVVQILNYGAGDMTKPASSGSGAVIDVANGYVVTNFHVVREAAALKVVLADGRQMEARLIGEDPATDLALLQVQSRDLTALTMVDSGSLRVGDVVVAVGFPFGLDQTVTAGIVSGLGRKGVGTQLEDFIQTDASINFGNSGGPLLDSRGRLIGVNTAIYSQSGGNVGIGFAVPTRIVTAVLDQLKAHGKVQRGAIGVEVEPTGPAGSGQQGARVTKVAKGSSAEAAGLRPGDVILAANGETVRQSADLKRIIGLIVPGRTARIDYRRGTQGLSATLTVRPAAAPEETWVASDGATPDLGASFGEIPAGHPLKKAVTGIIIRSVDPNGPLGQRGLVAGDIITQVNQTPIESLVDFQKALARNPGRKTFVIARGNVLLPLTVD